MRPTTKEQRLLRRMVQYRTLRIYVPTCLNLLLSSKKTSSVKVLDGALSSQQCACRSGATEGKVSERMLVGLLIVESLRMEWYFLPTEWRCVAAAFDDDDGKMLHYALCFVL